MKNIETKEKSEFCKCKWSQQIKIFSANPIYCKKCHKRILNK